MVGFGLGEILGRSIDTAEERVERLENAFAALIAAFVDLRFSDAHAQIDAMRSEVGTLEILLQFHGVAATEAEDTEGGPA